MRILRNLLATLVVLASIVFGLIAAIKNPPTNLATPPEPLFAIPVEVTQVADKAIGLIGGPPFVFWACVGLAVSGLFTVAFSFMGGRRHRDIRVELEGGSVVMSEAAIRSYLENAMSEFPEIGVKKIGIYTGSRGILIQMQADLRTQQHVPDLEQSIITRIHVALVKELGISKVEQVLVSVAGFRPTAGGMKAQPALPVPAPKAPAAKSELAVEPPLQAKPASAVSPSPSAPASNDPKN